MAIKPSVKYLTEKLGCEVKAVNNSEEALKLLRNQKKQFHLILIDYIMPGMNGLELLERINKQKINAEIIIMSGNPNDEMITRAKKLGAIEIISKPYSLVYLEDKIRQLLINRAERNKKNFIDQLQTESEISLRIKETREVDEYFSGSEILKCLLNNKMKIRLVSLFLQHLDVSHGMCISVSRGCPKKCRKCFSGTRSEFNGKHFIADEIVAMVKLVLNQSFYYDKRFWLYGLPFFVANMGSGDITFNFDETMSAMEKLKKVFGQRFVCNISTAFSVGVKKLSTYVIEHERKHKMLIPNLQVSVDSLSQKIRELMIDSNEDPFDLIKEAIKYHKLTGKKITANFVMCAGLNDTKKEVLGIIKFLPASIFRIKMSKSKLPDDSGLVSSSPEIIQACSNELISKGFEVEIFDEKKQMGFETGGSCGAIVHDD